MQIDRTRFDIEEGCEGAAEAMVSWIDAIVSGDFDRLETIFDDRMRMTCDPIANGGRFNKSEFIALDRHIRDLEFEFLGLTARRCEDIVLTQMFARVKEDFEGDLGPTMPRVEDLKAYLSETPMAYASMWRADETGQWRCVQHHVFGAIGAYRP